MTGYHIVEARGMACPWPALRLAKAMRSHAKIAVYLDPAQPRSELELVCASDNWAKSLDKNGDTYIFKVCAVK